MLESEILNRVLDKRQITRQEIIDVYEDSSRDPSEIYSVAHNLRSRFKADLVTFSKKAFLNIVNLCRDTCSYCTYKAEPSQDAKVSMMSRQDVAGMLCLAKRYKCVEVLLVAGERPESRYNEAREWLKHNGFGSTAEYLTYVSEEALQMGLFPHTNAGNMSIDEMRQLGRTNVSLGVMLENVSARLVEKGMPHHGAPSKMPEARLGVLEDAGRLGIPMTTGILIGIGETAEEIIDSLLAIKRLHHRYGNIQEVILQNFQPKTDTAMRNFAPAAKEYFKRIVALARIILQDMNIQIPPNLSPKSYAEFLSVGINDWGGISPLTPDFVNPEFSWPGIDKVEHNTRQAGFRLGCRFPVYPEFFSFVGKELREKMSEISNRQGLVREQYWR